MSTLTTRCLIVPMDAVFHNATPLRLVQANWRPELGAYDVMCEIVGGEALTAYAGKGCRLFYNKFHRELGLPENLVATHLCREANSLSMADWIGGIVGMAGIAGVANDHTDLVTHGVDVDVPDEMLDHLTNLGCRIEPWPATTGAPPQFEEGHQ